MKKKGFTLIELMIVVAIIGILAAVAIPNMAYTRKKARLSACISNLKSIASGVDMYAGDNDDTYPATAVNIVEVLNAGGYLQSASIQCPVGKANYTYALDAVNDLYTVTCTTPTEHYYTPKLTLVGLYFRNDVGVVEVKQGGEVVPEEPAAP